MGKSLEIEVAGASGQDRLQHTERLQDSAYNRSDGADTTAQFHPDQIHAHKTEIDTLLRSAFMESQAGRPSSSAHSLEDFRAAIDAADKFGTTWTENELQAVRLSMGALPPRQLKVTDDFLERLDQLPTDTRQKINDLRFPISHDYRDHHAETWTMHGKEFDQIMSLLPEDMKKQFSELRDIDFKVESTFQSLDELDALAKYPLKTRLLAAREYAHQGDIAGSQKVLNDMLHIEPGLAHHPQFGQIFENPTSLSDGVQWDGTCERSQNQQPKSLWRQLEEELLEERQWSPHIPKNDSGSSI